MTELIMIESRIKLAEAMGWRTCVESRANCMGSRPDSTKPHWQGNLEYLPNPYESEADNAALVDWMLDHGWTIKLFLSNRIQLPNSFIEIKKGDISYTAYAFTDRKAAITQWAVAALETEAELSERGDSP